MLVCFTSLQLKSGESLALQYLRYCLRPLNYRVINTCLSSYTLFFFLSYSNILYPPLRPTNILRSFPRRSIVSALVSLLNLMSCFSCLSGGFKYYHFENFTFARSRENLSTRTYSSGRSSFKSIGSRGPRIHKKTTKKRHSHTGLPRVKMNNNAFVPQAGLPPTGRLDHGRDLSPIRRTVSPPKRVSFAPVTVGDQGGHLSNYTLPPDQASSRPSQQIYASPPGLPPSYPSNSSGYLETHSQSQGQPPSKFHKSEVVDEDPPPYEKWLSIPDNSLLPPPPSITYHTSPTFNANASDANRAHAWTRANPLWPPKSLSQSERQALSIGYSSLIKPRELIGDILPDRRKPGIWAVRTKLNCGDSCLLSSAPLYSALNSSPLHSGQPELAYFEVRVGEMDKDAGIAVGFTAPPYPTWRLPGWERGSLGVHGDDGRRYVNDTWGGRPFTSAFRPGDIVGIGMKFKSSTLPPTYDERKKRINVEVFFTRNGQVEQGWDLHEEVDAKVDQPGGVTGLEGDCDLYAAVGVFGAAEFTILFGRHNWAWRSNKY